MQGLKFARKITFIYVLHTVVELPTRKIFHFSSDCKQWELSSHKYFMYFVFYCGNCEVDIDCHISSFMAFKVLSELCACGIELSIKLDTSK
jgi:hypothetical protein